MIANLEKPFIRYSADASQPKTLSGSIVDILSAQTTRVNSTAADLNQAQAVQTGLQANYGNLSGVNIDEEMSQLILLQNAYNASNQEGLVYDYRYRKSAVLDGLPILPVLGVRGEL